MNLKTLYEENRELLSEKKQISTYEEFASLYYKLKKVHSKTPDVLSVEGKEYIFPQDVISIICELPYYLFRNHNGAAMLEIKEIYYYEFNKRKLVNYFSWECDIEGEGYLNNQYLLIVHGSDYDNFIHNACYTTIESLHSILIAQRVYNKYEDTNKLRQEFSMFKNNIEKYVKSGYVEDILSVYYFPHQTTKDENGDDYPTGCVVLNGNRFDVAPHVIDWNWGIKCYENRKKRSKNTWDGWNKTFQEINHI